MTPPDRPEGSRSHMLLLVDLPDGRWLADVGFGGYLLGDPVRFAPNVQQRTSSGTVRIVEDRSSFTLQASLPSGWQDVYRFTLEPQLPIDYVVANWYTSTYPTSFFTQHLLVQNVTATGRTSLVDARFTERPFEGPAVERVLTSPDELAEVLTQVFAITPPVEPVEIWARLPKG
jgi:N-hydroxyarylamine O-acetyltransferase